MSPIRPLHLSRRPAGLRAPPRRRRLLAAAGLLFAAVLSAPAAAQMSTQTPDNIGTFVTPGYPVALPQSGLRDRPLPAGPAGGSMADPVLRNSLPAAPERGAAGMTRRGSEAYEDAGRAPRRAEPAPPSEFQKFVEASTGRLLPVFGASFFAETADSASQLDNVPVTADYVVGPGDELIVRAWGSIDVDYRATVDRTGQINLPKVGTFTVAGVKASDLEKQLRAQIGRLYTNFNLSVSLGQLRALKVFVVGPAQRPGVYTLPSQSTLLSAVAAAGGPGPNGSMRRIALRRDGRVIAELDVYDFLVQGDKSKDVQLAAGDVVVLRPAGPRVAIAGALDNAAVYELKGREEPLAEVLRYAGGKPVLASPNRAQLERVDPSQQAARFVEEVRFDAAGLAKPLRDGDVLTLLAISPAFANAVTLKGHVAQPLRYPWRPGMRIRDLIPDKEALITPGFYRRKNLLVQVIEPDDESLTPFERQRSLDRDRRRIAAAAGGSASPATTTGLGASLLPGAPAAAGALQSQSQLQSQAGTPRAASTSRLPTDTERARADDLAAAERARRTPAALFDALNWDYAVVERLDRSDLTTKVIPFNLGRAVLQGDPAENIELLAGDVVTIYSQTDIRVPVSRQTRLVAIEGEVGAPGVYQLQGGETLKMLVARAGGFTPQAYVYGLEVTREETRQRQRENLATAIARVEALAATQAARDAANTRNDINAASSAAVSSAAAQAQMVRLSRIQPNGRIALELSPDTHSIDQLPELPLENADRVMVPPRPGFVTVAGAVVNSNAFIWKPGRTAGDYLKLAGIDEAADPSNAFILRADGTVRHANDERGLFGRRGSIEAQVLQPGDAVVIPNQLDFETWGRALVRNLKDFSQIFSGFGIGIAAINTLSK